MSKTSKLMYSRAYCSAALHPLNIEQTKKTRKSNIKQAVHNERNEKK